MGRDRRVSHMDLVAATRFEQSRRARASSSGCPGTLSRLDPIGKRSTEHDRHQADQRRRAPDAGRDRASNGETQHQPNGDGQTNPSSNSDADASADADAKPNPCANSDTDANPDPNPNPNSDTDANPDPNPNTNANANANANASGAADVQPRLYDRDGERGVD